MNIQAEKLELMQLLLDTEDVSILKTIRDVFGANRADNMSEIVGQTPHGQPITKRDLIERDKQADRDFAEGNVITLEELRKESES